VIVVFCIICSMLNCFFILSPYIGEHTWSSTVSSISALNSQRTWQPSNHGNRDVIHAKGTNIVYREGGWGDWLTTVLPAEVACSVEWWDDQQITDWKQVAIVARVETLLHRLPGMSEKKHEFKLEYPMSESGFKLSNVKGCYPLVCELLYTECQLDAIGHICYCFQR
jgi:hypothetical protein